MEEGFKSVVAFVIGNIIIGTLYFLAITTGIASANNL
jgi:hypothetical protein